MVPFEAPHYGAQIPNGIWLSIGVAQLILYVTYYKSSEEQQMAARRVEGRVEPFRG